MTGHTLRQRLDERLATLKTERSPREHEWRLIQKLALPRRGKFNVTDRTSGRDKHAGIVNNTASRSLRTMAHGLAANVINPASPWFRLTPEEDELNEYGPVRQWLDRTERRAYQILSASGFYGAATVEMFEIGGFGTCALARERDFETVVKWHPWTTGEYWIANDARDRAHTAYREWQCTIETLIGSFGLDRVSLAVRDQYDRGNLDGKVTIRHAIEPWSQRFASKPGLQRWPYVSLYWDPSEPRADWFLSTGGTKKCPALIGRWEHVPPDAYGNGPLMDALGDVAGLQSVEKRLVQGIDRKTGAGGWQGPAQGFSGGVLNAFSQEPNAYNAVQGATSITPLIDPRSIQLQDAQWYYETLQRRIEKQCFVDLFLTFMEGARREMTATEVLERAREKLLLGPVLHNINSEVLNPAVDGILQDIFDESARFWAAGEDGMVPVPPQELQGQQLKIEYVSELQQAQRMVRAEPIYRLAAFVGQNAQFDPTLPMKADFHQMVDELSLALGAPPKSIRDDETVAQMQAAQDEERQRQAQMQQMAAGADVAAKLGKASTLPGTALGDLAREQEAA
jgi:hypothetical protein